MSNDGQIKTAEHDNMLCDVCWTKFVDWGLCWAGIRPKIKKKNGRYLNFDIYSSSSSSTAAAVVFLIWFEWLFDAVASKSRLQLRWIEAVWRPSVRPLNRQAITRHRPSAARQSSLIHIANKHKEKTLCNWAETVTSLWIGHIIRHVQWRQQSICHPISHPYKHEKYTIIK
jgi:hypothetical protein